MYCIENQHIFAIMIRSYNLTGLNPESLKDFIDFANNNSDEDCLWNIIVNSDGGDTNVESAIRNILDMRNQLFPDTIILSVVKAFSSAFNLLCKTDCKIVILEECRGMIHQTRWFMDMNANSKVNKSGENYKEMIDKEMNDYINTYSTIYNKFLTKEEMKKFKEGEDIYFEYNRMKLIFNNKQKQNESSKSRKAIKKKSNS